MDYYSPLRYPGGKSKISPFVKQLFKENQLCDGVYVEPYAGGASVALALLFNEYASKVIINDFDLSIYAFWHSVINSTDDLCKLIRDTPLDVENWVRQKDIQRTEKKRLLKLGFSTFYLNRTNRSGIIDAGIIGGKDQQGKWKIDARFNKEELINRIRRIAQYKTRIELFNDDAVNLIKKIKAKLPQKALFYFDPPYYIKGKDLYLNYYNDKNHVEIFNEIDKINKQRWILTYDNVGFIQNLYKGFRQVKYQLNYSAAKASKGNELMILSHNIFIPLKPDLKGIDSIGLN